MIGTIQLKTGRLILRRHVIEDADFLYRRFGSDEKMYEYSGWNPYATPDMAKETVQNFIKSYDDDAFFGWAIEKDGAIIGTIGAYDHDPQEDSIEVGTSIDRDYWGRGYATEALEAVLRYLTEDNGISNVKAWCASDNLGSAKAMERCGMVLEDVEKDALSIGNKQFDKYNYVYRKEKAMDRKSIKYAVVIQCDHTLNRCSGFACSEAFFGRSAGFAGYEDGTKYLTMSCGGCCGAGVAGRLEHFETKLRKLTDIQKSEVAVHLATCVVTDNRHHDRCPYVDYIKEIIRKNGFENIVEGTYQSQASRKLREEGVYKKYDSVDFE